MSIKMKISNLNITLEWETIRNIPEFLEIEQEFPSYDIVVKNKDNLILNNFYNLNDHEPIIEQKVENLEFAKKTKLFSSILKNKTKNKFIYSFENNYKIYKNLNNKVGYYKDIKFLVKYHNSNQEFIFSAEYEELDLVDKNLLFNKIYRGSDYLTIKMMINKNYYKEKNIYSFLILSEASNKVLKNKKLLNLFTENIKAKWLDVNETTALLTVPFIESDILEITENLNVTIIPLNYLQSEMYNFLKTVESEEDINIFYKDFFPNQTFSIGKIYRQAVNNETLIFYQNYIYLFNNESLTSNSLQTDISINDITFNRYFPLLNKDNINKTICLSDDLNTDDVLDNIYNIQKDYLGYYSKNLTDYEDVAIDLDYLQNQGIKRVNIAEIEELTDTCNIYIEFITNFYSNEKLYIETSNNLKFYEKYKTIIDDKEYITFLFKYSYNLDTLNEYLSENPDKNKSQIIADKDLINFSAKLIL